MLDNFAHDWLLVTLIFTRIGGMLIVAPAFAWQSVPAPVRVLFALMLAIVVAPLVATGEPPTVVSLPQLALFACREALLGMSIGLAIRILFAGFMLSGALAGHTSGLRLAEVPDAERQTTTPVLSRFLEIATLATFFLIGGHRQVITVLLDSMQWSPPGSEFAWAGMIHALVEIMTQSFIVAIRLAAPVVAALLLTILVIGLISRTVPQLNSLSIGLNLQSLVLLAVLTCSLGSVSWILEAHTGQAMATLKEAFVSHTAAATMTK